MVNTHDVNAVEIVKVSKAFNRANVVDNVTFDVKQGEIFGLIGPNGAGKTTTIRMLMDIIKPDAGQVRIFGKTLREQTKNKIGYLPEERGLYQKLSVLESLCYLATLKGIENRQAQVRANELLKRVGLQNHKDKKIRELSRGLGQIVQFLTTIIHDPDLIILDEPFANLDPVNTELVKEIIYEFKVKDKAIILSTHRMNEVEELCDRIFMINEGQGVLYGGLKEIKHRYQKNSVFLQYEGELGDLAGTTLVYDKNGSAELILDKERSPQDILEQLIHRGIRINRFEVSTPPLHDIFLQVVSEGQ
jgi:ABC-2 type transport system ATP-binding protein